MECPIAWGIQPVGDELPRSTLRCQLGQDCLPQRMSGEHCGMRDGARTFVPQAAVGTLDLNAAILAARADSSRAASSSRRSASSVAAARMDGIWLFWSRRIARSRALIWLMDLRARAVNQLLRAHMLSQYSRLGGSRSCGRYSSGLRHQTQNSRRSPGRAPCRRRHARVRHLGEQWIAQSATTFG